MIPMTTYVRTGSVWNGTRWAFLRTGRLAARRWTVERAQRLATRGEA